MLAPTSPADVLDRLTILDLKVARIADPARRAVALRHREALDEAWRGTGLPDRHDVPEAHALAEVNTALWEVEDALRDHEARADFGLRFVEHARSVYRLNDRRAAIKSAFDQRLGALHADIKAYGAGRG